MIQLDKYKHLNHVQCKHFTGYIKYYFEDIDSYNIGVLGSGEPRIIKHKNIRGIIANIPLGVKVLDKQGNDVTPKRIVYEN